MSREIVNGQKAAAPEVFATTRWSLVLRAAAGSPDSAAALETLCRAYWYPVYGFVRRQGAGPEEAQDLTQQLFHDLLERKALATVHPDKGRFRSFLLASAKNLMANAWRKSQRQKRGGGVALFSLDETDAEGRFLLEPADPLDPEKVFNRRWAETLLARVLDTLEAEWRHEGRPLAFEELKVFLVGARGEVPFTDQAARLGVTEPALKKIVHNLRRRYRELFFAEIAETVAGPEEVEAEIRHLLAALAG